MKDIDKKPSLEVFNTQASIERGLKYSRETTNKEEVDKLCYMLILAHKEKSVVIITGRGNSESVGEMFTTRLRHTGIEAFYLGDRSCPPVDKKTFFVAISGSGNTKGVITEAKEARKLGAEVILITSNAKNDNALAKIADHCISIKGRTKDQVEKERSYVTDQVSGKTAPDVELESDDGEVLDILATQFEINAFSFVMSVCKCIVKATGQTEAMLKRRHKNVE